MFSIDGPLHALIQQLARLPGLGPRSARRMAFYLLSEKPDALRTLNFALENAASSIKTCESCGTLDDLSPCRICQSVTREKNSICVVASVPDLWAIERTGNFRGQYHVLGGILSAIDGMTPDKLRMDGLMARIEKGGIDEVILALSATVDGQTTMHYLTDMLGSCPNLKITRLAHGMPIGGELDYLDQGTIVTALQSRKDVAR